MALVIDRPQFEREHAQYRGIQGHGINVLRAHQNQLPPEAQQFYLNSQELSFVFEKDLVLDLLNQPFAKYLRVYYGAVPPGPNPKNKDHGSPTLILGAAIKINPYFDIGNLYVEWPTGLDQNGEEI